MDESGVSLGTTISLRPSLSATSAALSIRFDELPQAIADNVDILHGTTAMALIL